MFVYLAGFDKKSHICKGNSGNSLLSLNSSQGVKRAQKLQKEKRKEKKKDEPVEMYVSQIPVLSELMRIVLEHFVLITALPSTFVHFGFLLQKLY